MNSKETIKIVLASSSRLFIEGIRRILAGEKEIEIVAEVSNPDDIQKYTLELKPEFLFIDNRMLSMDIQKLLSLISKKLPDVYFIVMNNQSEYPPELDLTNITYVTKEMDSSDLIKIIKKGKSLNRAGSGKADKVGDKITRMESKVIELIAQGYSNKEIASRLSISEKTVKAHLTNIFVKLNLENRYQLIVYGAQHKRRAR
ncbi:MAG TPA: response regulator transcription factor [Thermodesulfobacteriota bacterium]|nr:response regulator transcription factor [Thermodesulfobacteriota bacterium]